MASLSTANCRRISISLSLTGVLRCRGLVITICLPFLTWNTLFPILPCSMISMPFNVVIVTRAMLVFSCQFSVFDVYYLLSCWVGHSPAVLFERGAKSCIILFEGECLCAGFTEVQQEEIGIACGRSLVFAFEPFDDCFFSFVRLL